MAAVWTDENKFKKWLEVELAVLRVRERRGEIPEGTAEGIAKVTQVNAAVARAINEGEKVNGHDLLSFVEVMRGQMHAAPARKRKLKWDALFHEGMTSYDTEEPAMSLLFFEADGIILEGIMRVKDALLALATKHRGQAMIDRTHGQWAQPVTFGKRCLDWFEMVRRAEFRLAQSAEEVGVMKLSGAVGMYGTLVPDIEADVAEELHLEVAPIATQIIPLDRRAQQVNSLAELAAVIEKIARDLWLLSQSEIGEVREPFGKKQKGSSAMPHKKNPITLEKLFGLPRLIRAYAHVMLENVATAHARDISHSSVERIVVPDAYGLVDHMLQQLGRVLEGLDVFPDRMAENLAATQGTFASQEVRDLLGRKGMSGEDAYRVVQTACFIAMQSRVPLRRLLFDSDDFADAAAILRDDPGFDQLFDPAWWVRREDVYYKRFGL